jgi:hypothetical protein
MRFAVAAYDRRLRGLVIALDRDGAPVAATWRAVGAAADRLGLRRPSYYTVRRLVILERLRERQTAAQHRTGGRLVRRLRLAARVDVSIGIERRGDAWHDEHLVLQQHKRPPPRRVLGAARPSR